MLDLRLLKNISGFLSSGGVSCFPCPCCLITLYGRRCSAPRFFPYLWRRKHNPGGRCRPLALHTSRGLSASRLALRPVSRLVHRLVLLACLICPAGLIRSSSHPLPTGFAAYLIRSPLLIGSSVRPLPRIALLPVPSTSGAGRYHNRRLASRRAVDRRANGGGCLLPSDGGGRRAGHRCGAAAACLPRMGTADGGGSSFGWRADSGGCLLASGRWTERFDRSLIVSFPISSAQSNRLRFPVRLISISHHLIDGNGFSFPFPPDPLPPALLCLLAGACSPVPGRGRCGLRYGLRWRACGLLACVLISRSALSLLLVRLLLYAPVSPLCVVLSGALCGDLLAILAAILSALAYFNICPQMASCGFSWAFSAILSSVISRLSPSPRSRPSALLLVPSRLRCHGRWCGCFPAVSW